MEEVIKTKIAEIDNLIKEEKYEDCIKVLRGLIEKYPAIEKFYSAIVFCCLSIEKFKQARFYCKKSIDNCNNPMNYHYLCHSYLL